MSDETPKQVPPPPPRPGFAAPPPPGFVPPPPPGFAPFPPPPFPPPWYPAAPEKSQSKVFLVLSFVCAVLPLACISQIVGIIFAILHLTKRDGLRGLAITAIVVNVVMVVVWVAVFGAFNQHASTSSGSSVQTTQPATPNAPAPRLGSMCVADLQVGDCGTDRLGNTIDLVNLVSCNKKHRFEVFAVFTLPRGRYPGDSTVHDLARGGCAARFKKYVGRSVDTSKLDWWSIRPLKEGWSESRGVQCLLVTKFRVGSLRGSKE